MTDVTGYKVYRNRWLMLALLIPIIVANELFWLTFAPIEKAACAFYNTSTMNIALFSISYMLMFIIFTMPASYVIEKYGYKVSVVIGTLLTVVFGAARYFFADSFIIVLIAQFLLAAGQPFLINISTKVSANWFPEKERSTAAGLLVMAQYLGFIAALIFSTILIEPLGMKNMLGIYALFALAVAIPAFFAKEKPPAAPGPEAPKESMRISTMLRLFKSKQFVLVLLIGFIAIGLFNTLMTKVDQIFGTQETASWLIGVIFLASGIAGAVVLPIISDKLRSRTPFFIAGTIFMALLIGFIAYFSGFGILAAASAVLGFVVMGLAPILFQHGAEVAYPIQEGASFGTIMLMGQVSGILFVVLFEIIQGAAGGAVVWPMIFLIALAVIQIPVAAMMKESAIIRQMKAQSKN
jgi:FLVCR family MFS transporter 7